jgi:hypothetical protein
MIIKKSFNFTPEANEIWNHLWRTRGTKSESGALVQFLYDLDQSLRNRLDAEGLTLYEASELTRSEMGRAFERYRARRAAANGGAEKQPAVVR